MTTISLSGENGTSRKYLTSEELEKVFDACSNPRDKALCRLSYRHGLRCSEALNLTWDAVDFKDGRLFIQRLKNGLSTTHPLSGEETRYLRALKRDAQTPYLFESNRQSQLSARAVRKLFKGIEAATGIEGLHHHQLRHSCGFHLANKGIPVLQIKDWLGHKSIENTMIYVTLASKHLDKLRDW